MKSPKTPKIAILERLLNSRLPLVGEVVRREAFVRLIQDGSPEALDVLLHTGDPAMYHTTLEAFREGHPETVKTYHLPGNQGTHQVVSIKSDHGLRRRGVAVPSRSRILADWDAAKRFGWRRAVSVEEAVRNALKTGDLNYFKSPETGWIGPLLELSNEFDRRLRANVEKVLNHMEEPELLEALCRKLIEKEYPLAHAIVVRKSVFPQDPVARALFFFVTEQGDRYEALDLDRRLLRAAYVAENADVRRRIREKLRAAGRPELLTVITGQGAAGGVAEMTDDEYEFVVGMLRSHQDWGRLWQMIPETTVFRGVRILKVLASAGWQPPEADRALFAELRTLLEAGLLLDPEALSQEFPRILLHGQLHASGRIHDVAFAPHRPWLGISTRARKVVLWNYQTARRECELKGFERPVGRIIFARDGNLVCAERSKNLQTASGIYVWDGRALRRIGEHRGQVTALEAVSGSTVLSAGRDGDLVLWDTASGQQITRHTLPDWPRATRVAPDGELVMLALRRETQWLSLANMRLVTHARHQVAPTCGAFALQGNVFLLVGRRDGSVMFYRRRSPWLHREHDLCTHKLSVQGIEVLPKRGYILTAGREGEARFFDLVKRDQLDSVQLSGEGLTSLRVSPDEAFMVVGHKDGFSLWDLRGADVAALVSAPMASLPPLSLGMLDAFAKSPNVREPVRRLLTYMALVVRHRIRFDIEVEPVSSSIVTGEFDIEL